MVKKKGKSKRTTLKDKYKVQKRIVDTHRKRKKEAKKDAKSGKVIPKRKDPGIPNTWPFKADLLQEIQRTRQRQQEQQDQVKKQRQEQLQSLREHQRQGGSARTIKELMEQAQRDQQAFAVGQEAQEKKTQKAASESSSKNLGQNSRRAYWKELKKVVDSADVLLQVLDARDPIGTRIAKQVEDTILSYPNKRMILLLNKMDLIPKHVVKEWLVFLRKSHPTIAISTTKTERLPNDKKDAGNNNDDDNASTMTKSSTSASSATTALGMDGLLQLLKNYARNDDGTNKKSKTAIVVGVIGYPNVGKSSIINSMKRCRAVGTSPTPGYTTCMQEVVLDQNVRLLDSPGIVFDDNSALLNNCVNMDGIDPFPAVQALLQRASMNSLIMTYNIPAFYPQDNVEMFLSMVAKSQGKVGKGGIPDKAMAARAVLRDWNTGKIPYFTVPPKHDPSSTDASDSPYEGAVVVSQMAKEFDLSAFDEKLFSKLQDSDEMDFVQLNSDCKEDDGMTSEEAMMILRGEELDDDEDDVEMDEEEEGEEDDEEEDEEEDEDMD
jgi:nuclear GTP-binding protein